MSAALRRVSDRGRFVTVAGHCDFAGVPPLTAKHERGTVAVCDARGGLKG